MTLVVQLQAVAVDIQLVNPLDDVVVFEAPAAFRTSDASEETAHLTNHISKAATPKTQQNPLRGTPLLPQQKLLISERP